VTGLAILATIVVLIPLAAILIYLFYKGFSSLNVAFFTRMPAPPGDTGGGMANSIVGSGVILALASLIGIPVGIAAGVYLAEFGRGTMLGNAVRFTADVLNGVPSIVIGISMYALRIYKYANSPFDEWHRLAWAGSLVLILMIMVSVTLVRVYASRGQLKGGN
jgi:phosphate transport system permease protein